MSNIFSKELLGAVNIKQVSQGALRVLAEQNPPLSYLVGGLDLTVNHPDSRLAFKTALVQRYRPNVFSDANIFNPQLVNLLQSYGRLKPEELLEFRSQIIGDGNLESVMFLPDWDRTLEVLPLFRLAQTRGRLIYILENTKDHTKPHDWLAFNS